MALKSKKQENTFVSQLTVLGWQYPAKCAVLNHRQSKAGQIWALLTSDIFVEDVLIL